MVVFYRVDIARSNRYHLIMVNGKPNNPNMPGEGLGRSSGETARSSQESERSEDLNVRMDTSGILEGVDGAEDGAEAMGHVGEAKEGLGEQQKGTAGKFQQFSTKMTDEQAAALKAKLLASPPSQKKMVQEIRAHIHKEIVELQRQARHFQKTGSFHDLSLTVSKIRELKGLLSRLWHATAEFVKAIWLKVVHGIA